MRTLGFSHDLNKERPSSGANAVSLLVEEWNFEAIRSSNAGVSLAKTAEWKIRGRIKCLRSENIVKV